MARFWCILAHLLPRALVTAALARVWRETAPAWDGSNRTEELRAQLPFRIAWKRWYERAGRWDGASVSHPADCPACGAPLSVWADRTVTQRIRRDAGGPVKGEPT